MLNHTALYAKNWYHHSGNVWNDVLKCIIADDYTPMSCELKEVLTEENYERAAILMEEAKNNIIIILTNNIANLTPNDKAWLLQEFIEATDKKSCWRHGYYHDEFWGKGERDNLEPYDYKTAVLYFFLSRLVRASAKELWGENPVPKPDTNVLPLRQETKVNIE